MNLKDKIKTLINKRKYLKYIEKHLDNIEKAAWEMIECPKLNSLFMDEELCYNFLQRIKNHDKSKYSEEEFNAYRKYYHPINPEEKESVKEDYAKAWEHHWKNNDHHWQARQNKTSFDVNNDEDVLPLLENVADWLAMGYEFGNRPYQYYELNKDKIQLCPEEREFLEKIIYGALEDKTQTKPYLNDSIAR